MAGYVVYAILGITQIILTMHWERVIRLPLSDGNILPLRRALAMALVSSFFPVFARGVDLFYALSILGVTLLFYLMAVFIPSIKTTLWHLSGVPRSINGNLGAKRDVTINLVADGDTYRIATSDELFGYTKFDMIRITTWEKEMRVTAPLGELEHYFQAIGLEQRPEPTPVFGLQTKSWQEELAKGPKRAAVVWLKFVESPVI